jgi:hypothetical protein
VQKTNQLSYLELFGVWSCLITGNNLYQRESRRFLSVICSKLY